MPASTVGSSPGRGCRNTSATAAASVRRGSITISFMPRARASRNRLAGLYWGIPPHIDTVGLAPTRSHVSARSNGWGPADQVPCRARATPLPGWSMAPDEKRIFEPMACMNALAISLPAG